VSENLIVEVFQVNGNRLSNSSFILNKEENVPKCLAEALG